MNFNEYIEEYKTTPGALLVDLRNPEDYEKAHVPGAVNLHPEQIREEIRKLQPEESCLPPVEYYKDKIEVLSYALEQYTNISDDTTDDIPESVIEAFVKKIIVCEDHFEWYLRLGSGTDGGDGPVNLKIEGKKDKTTVISTDNGGLRQPIYEHGRQLYVRSRHNYRPVSPPD